MFRAISRAMALCRPVRRLSELAKERGFLSKCLVRSLTEVLSLQPIHKVVSGDGYGSVDEVLRSVGIPERKIVKICRANPSLLSCSPLQLRANLQTLETLDVEKKCIERFIQRCPALLSIDLEHRVKLLEPELHKIGMERKVIGKIMVYRTDWLLSRNSGGAAFSRIVEFFLSYGLSTVEVERILLRFPFILICSSDEKLDSLPKLFDELEIDKLSAGKMLRKCPSLVTLHVDRTLKPKMDFLRNGGLSNEMIVRIVTCKPDIFGRSLVKCLLDRKMFLSKIGCDTCSSKFAYSLACIAGLKLEVLEERLKYFMGLGLPEDDCLRILRFQPRILCRRIDNVQARLAYLLDDLKYPLSTISTVPTYLLYSFDKRIKPRCRLMAWLYSNGILKKRYALGTILSMSEQKFKEKFLEKYAGSKLIYQGVPHTKCDGTTFRSKDEMCLAA